MVNLDALFMRVSKPARYAGGEWNAVHKDWEAARARMVLLYPDVYEVGMSNLGISILYDIVNSRPGFLLERCFSPWVDMEAALRESRTPLFSLESRRPLGDFDVVGFSLAHELTYTNVLNALDLAGVPVRSAERGEHDPLVIAGGAGAYNPEPMVDFVDLFVVGDGEEALPELLAALDGFIVRCADGGRVIDRPGFLRRAAAIEGVYVPSLYTVSYRSDGWVAAVEPLAPEAPPVVRRRLVRELPPVTVCPVVPTLNTVHDRGAVEIMRGCPGGCRFCQAGHTYRPVRMRNPDQIAEAFDRLLRNTGYEEISLLSLSTGDYPGIDGLVRRLAARHPDVNISLPSLRIDTFSVDLARSVQRRKAGLTFAPEAGTQRLRDVIHKRVTERDLLAAAEAAYAGGWSTVKLYFMIGLPTEEMEDVLGIARLAWETYEVGRRVAGRRAQLHVSVATFVPKPHTPFQWWGQNRPEELRPKHEALRAGMGRRIALSWHDPESSFLEAALSRGDRRLGEVILRAWRAGSRFEAWSEHLRPHLWRDAARQAGVDLEFHAYRKIATDETLPWSHIRSGVGPEHLRRQYDLALARAEDGVEA